MWSNPIWKFLTDMALTLALTRTMLSLPYRADTAEDLERAVRVAIHAASLSRHLMASSHQHPYVSTAKGMQTQPKRLHFASLEACLRASATDAVDPAVTLAQRRIQVLGGGGHGWRVGLGVGCCRLLARYEK